MHACAHGRTSVLMCVFLVQMGVYFYLCYLMHVSDVFCFCLYAYQVTFIVVKFD